MPDYLPNIDDIIGGNIKFFSLDTSVLHKLGYDFSNDKLLHLYLQLPYQVKLLFPEVVYKEVLYHKEDEIYTDLKKLESAIKTLKRKKVLDDNLDFPINLLKEKYLENIEIEVKNYLEKFNSEFLNIKDCNIGDIFDSYFNKDAPFENKVDKKNEFPDAVCLHLLENYAKKNHQKGIVISDDKGWKKFTEKSQYLYYAESIDEFINLFVVRNDEFSEIISEKIINGLGDKKSNLYSQVVNSLDYVYWDTSAIYSENLYCCYADVISHHFRNFNVRDFNIWKSDKESATWILSIDILFDLELEIEVESYAKDWVDKELVSMGFTELSVNVNPEFQFHVICSNINVDSDCSEWDIDIKLINEQYTLDEIGICHSFE